MYNQAKKVSELFRQLNR